MLHVLVDTSAWLDPAKKRDGQKLIHAIGQVVLDGDVELLVPTIVLGCVGAGEQPQPAQHAG